MLLDSQCCSGGSVYSSNCSLNSCPCYGNSDVIHGNGNIHGIKQIMIGNGAVQRPQVVVAVFNGKHSQRTYVPDIHGIALQNAVAAAHFDFDFTDQRGCHKRVWKHRIPAADLDLLLDCIGIFIAGIDLAAFRRTGNERGAGIEIKLGIPGKIRNDQIVVICGAIKFR